ncbi:MAG: hypothetical protein GC168_01935 [Candidatus Hydrogenedens sp.]|nr:hypothetical protein [Candidatus Hydrogenedens sp.]
MAGCAAVAGAEDTAPNFRLIDQDGGIYELYRQDEAALVALVAFDGTDAALLEQAGGQKHRRKSKNKNDLSVALITKEPPVTRESIAALHAKAKATNPILLDTAGSVSAALGLRQPGDVVWIDPAAGWKIVGHTQAAAGMPASAEAAREAMLTPAALATPAADAAAAPAAISYSRDIAPILMARCVNCHTEGGIGPFAMNSHKKVAGWSAMMQEVVLTKRMPPWHADPEYQHFKNSIAMAPEEEATLMAWLRAGAPKADDEPDPLAEQAKPHDAGWLLGTPDHVVRMPEPVELPANDVIDYKYFYVSAGLTEDQWLSGVEVRAGNPKVVHHALIFAMYPPEYAHLQPHAYRGLGGFFASFLPGAEPLPFPQGTAQFLPAGSTFVFQMHYSPTGKPETDQTELGLHFADAPPAEVLQVRAITTTDFVIKPGLADQPVSVSYKTEEPMRLWGVLPHMHYRGQHFRYTFDVPGQAPEVLLNVPWYQFDWQPMYWYDAPKDYPAGTTLHCDGAFDNSKYNPTNPDPSKEVEFGEQSFDEMFIGYMAVSQPYDAAAFVPQPVERQYNEPITEATMTGTEWDIGEDRPLRFNKGGELKIAWYKGTWKIDGSRVVMNMGEDFYADIVGNELYLEGERMVRIK